LDIVPENNSIENKISIPKSISDQIIQAQLVDILINRACADNNIESRLSANSTWEQVFSFLKANNLIKLDPSLVSKVSKKDKDAISHLLSFIVDTLDEGSDNNQNNQENQDNQEDGDNNINNINDENKKGIDIQQKRLKSNVNNNKSEDSPKNKVVLPEEKPQPNLNLNSLDPKKNLNHSESMLEFVILVSCQKFSTAPKQSAGLLSNNLKLLAQIIIQGLKGDFIPVLEW